MMAVNDMGMPGGSVRRSSGGRAATGCRRFTLLMLLLLMLQFVVGEVVSLYITIPSVHPGAQAPDFFSGIIPSDIWALTDGAGILQLHVLGGIVLVVIALFTVIFGLATGRRGWIISSIVGLLGIVLSGFYGASFLVHAQPFDTLVMSLGFTLATVAYVLGLYAGG